MINFNPNCNCSNSLRRKRKSSSSVNFTGYNKEKINDELLSPLLKKALKFAQEKHSGQYRKHTERKIPFFNHVHNVGVKMKKMGFSDEESAAGALHDVIEDTKTTYKEIKEIFGKKVADLVDSVTEQDTALPWAQKKKAYFDRLESKSDKAKAISAIDKQDNMECDIEYFEDTGNKPFTLSKGSAKENIANRERLLKLIKRAQLPKELIDGYEKTLNKVKKICLVDSPKKHA